MIKKVLFLCVENSCRSQMAEGLARHIAKGKLEAYSAGSRPSGKVHTDAIKVMGEMDIDISRNQSKGFQDLPTQKFDYVISMGCQDRCPFIPAKENLDWSIEDPKGKDLEFFRKTRDQIKSKIEELIMDLSHRQKTPSVKTGSSGRDSAQT